MEREKLNTLLENHKKWLEGDPEGIRASLKGSDLSEMDLRVVNLSKADLEGADLRWSDLRWSDLSGADLRFTDLKGAYLSKANLRETKMNLPIACPEEGSFIGFKKSREEYIIKLLITEDAKRSSATTRKCRCSKAKVLEISTIEGEEKSEARSQYDVSFVYRVGEVVEVENFDENRWDECSTGVHFFLTRQEAIDY